MAVTLWSQDRPSGKSYPKVQKGFRLCHLVLSTNLDLVRLREKKCDIEGGFLRKNTLKPTFSFSLLKSYALKQYVFPKKKMVNKKKICFFKNNLHG